jgi:hypothetical protein
MNICVKKNKEDIEERRRCQEKRLSEKWDFVYLFQFFVILFFYFFR